MPEARLQDDRRREHLPTMEAHPRAGESLQLLEQRLEVLRVLFLDREDLGPIRIPFVSGRSDD